MQVPIKELLSSIPLSLLISCIVTFLFYLLCEKILHQKNKPIKYLYAFCFITYLLFLFEVMVGISGGFTFEMMRHQPNFVPLIDIINVYEMGFTKMITQIILNIIVAIPLGLFLPLIFQFFRSFPKTIVTILVLSAASETLQYFIGRSADIDDVIMYLIGGCLGYCLFYIGSKYVKRKD